MTKKELQSVFVTAAVAAVATTLTGLVIASLVEKAKENRAPQPTPEELRQAEEQRMLQEAQAWMLAGTGRYC
jgi:hypothetical protein